eukprot:CCRYP_008958-RA/>CCRYP_008958-RA protein AED:0.15 eAED:1.00 QI:0/-1/0/1/-1/0/1/0/113
MVFTSNNTTQTMGVLPTMHSNNTEVSKGKLLLTVESTCTSRMALQKEQLETPPRQQEQCCYMQKKMAKCSAPLFMDICGQDGCTHPQHCTSAAGWKITIRTIFWDQCGIHYER